LQSKEHKMAIRREALKIVWFSAFSAFNPLAEY